MPETITDRLKRLIKLIPEKRHPSAKNNEEKLLWVLQGRLVLSFWDLSFGKQTVGGGALSWFQLRKMYFTDFEVQFASTKDSLVFLF